MKRRIGAILDWMMGRGPMPWLGRLFNRRRLVVLAYHGVDDRKCFSGHLDHLKRKYNVVSLDQVLDSMENGSTLPSNSVLITFDDGERTVLTDGLPELKQRDMPSVLFAIADFIDTDAPFWWYEVEDLIDRGATSETLGAVATKAAAVAALKKVPDGDRLQAMAEMRASAGGDQMTQGQLTSDELRHLDAEGMVVENHSWSHPLLDMCPDDKVKQEVEDASVRLAEIIGRPMRAFAYPNGNYDSRVVSAVRGSGTKAAFMFDHRIDKWTPSEPMLISRVRVNSDCSANRFSAIVSGVHPACHRLRGGT